MFAPLNHSLAKTDIWKRVWMGAGEGGGEGVWNSLISKSLAHYSLSLKFLLIL